MLCARTLALCLIAAAPLAGQPAGGEGERADRPAAAASALAPRGLSVLQIGPFTLPAQRRLTIQFDATIDPPPPATSTVENQAEIKSEAMPPAFADVLSDDPDTPAVDDPTVTDLDFADLAITKTDGVMMAAPGGTLTYTIVASNNGPGNVVNAIVSDTLPPTLVCTWTCAGSGGASCTAAGAGDIADGAVDLPVGETATYTVNCTIAASATGTLMNTASISGTVDSSTANNSATDADTLLVPQTDLAITKADSADPPPGTSLTYTLTVTNNGPSNSTGGTVTDPLPTGTTFAGSPDGCTEAGGVVTCPVGPLAAGNNVALSFDVTIDLGTAGAGLTNTATVAANETDTNSANNSDTETTTLDAVPPQVTKVDSFAGSGDGVLAECESVRAAVSQLLVDFNEAMLDPAGDAGANDVTNPANYLLVGPGADHTFQTMSCAGPAGDDVALSIGVVSYSSATQRATLDLGGPIADGRYRLRVCATLADAAGNALDGDGNGTGDDDFARNFRVDRFNAFANAHFDCTLDSWTLTSTNPAEIVHDALVDADGALDAGSAAISNLTASSSFKLEQCVSASGAVPRQLRAKLRLDAAPSVLISYSQTCRFFGATGCTGANLGSQGQGGLQGATSGGFITLAGAVTPPVGAQSARCEFVLFTGAGASFDGWLDDPFFENNGLIFTDGFESGDTSAWTLTVP